MQNINLYSKEQTDSLLLDKADSDSVYTKSEIETMLTDYYSKSETYSKTELDNEFNDIDDVLNTMYTQNEIDGLLLSKANVSDVYSKSETYNKTEIDDIIESQPVYNGIVKIPFTLTPSISGDNISIGYDQSFQFKEDDLLVFKIRATGESSAQLDTVNTGDLTVNMVYSTTGDIGAGFGKSVFYFYSRDNVFAEFSILNINNAFSCRLYTRTDDDTYTPNIVRIYNAYILRKVETI